ncbi:hypothetical protein cyc_05068 [Cyclospora cayetanensis]|uniref:Uncharacterized protein n=1 Tax=Cyclospora cayetanensis TaxID=88456 RepID=A0A1D3D1B0_9EIME|nr:hypothetical protein cyc_05068 [Cyclospora cayetanensis]
MTAWRDTHSTEARYQNPFTGSDCKERKQMKEATAVGSKAACCCPAPSQQRGMQGIGRASNSQDPTFPGVLSEELLSGRASGASATPSGVSTGERWAAFPTAAVAVVAARRDSERKAGCFGNMWLDTAPFDGASTTSLPGGLTAASAAPPKDLELPASTAPLEAQRGGSEDFSARETAVVLAFLPHLFVPPERQEGATTAGEQAAATGAAAATPESADPEISSESELPVLVASVARKPLERPFAEAFVRRLREYGEAKKGGSLPVSCMKAFASRAASHAPVRPHFCDTHAKRDREWAQSIRALKLSNRQEGDAKLTRRIAAENACSRENAGGTRKKRKGRTEKTKERKRGRRKRERRNKGRRKNGRRKRERRKKGGRKEREKEKKGEGKEGEGNREKEKKGEGKKGEGKTGEGKKGEGKEREGKEGEAVGDIGRRRGFYSLYLYIKGCVCVSFLRSKSRGEVVCLRLKRKTFDGAHNKEQESWQQEKVAGGNLPFPAWSSVLSGARERETHTDTAKVPLPPREELPAPSLVSPASLSCPSSAPRSPFGFKRRTQWHESLQKVCAIRGNPTRSDVLTADVLRARRRVELEVFL